MSDKVELNRLVMPVGDYKGMFIEQIGTGTLKYFLEQEWFEEQYPEEHEEMERVLSEQRTMEDHLRR